MSKPQPHLSLVLKHRLGALTLDLAFELTQPWTVIFGPSGSGKSTILRAIAGLMRPDSGRIVLQRSGRTETLTDTAASIFVPVHQRPVRWSAQRAALFPNMTVRENLRFAVKAHGTEAVGLVESALARFRLTGAADRAPSVLSGGEQQRVSLARAAIGSQDCLLLLDEPFSGLDAPLRDELLTELRDWLAPQRTPVLSVTHDVGEAFLLGAEVIRLGEGGVLPQGPVAEVLANERLRLISLLDRSVTA